jgi:uncharacterized protein (TIGR00369 family)
VRLKRVTEATVLPTVNGKQTREVQADRRSHFDRRRAWPFSRRPMVCGYPRRPSLYHDTYDVAPEVRLQQPHGHLRPHIENAKLDCRWCSLVQRPEVSARKASDVLRVLFALRPGLDGAPGTLHGGVTTLLFDATLCMVAGLFRETGGRDGFNVTKELKVTYLRPVRTSCEVLVEATVVDVSKNRKYTVHGELRDGGEKVLARAEAICVAIDRPANL